MRYTQRETTLNLSYRPNPRTPPGKKRHYLVWVLGVFFISTISGCGDTIAPQKRMIPIAPCAQVNGEKENCIPLPGSSDPSPQSTSSATTEATEDRDNHHDPSDEARDSPTEIDNESEIQPRPSQPRLVPSLRPAQINLVDSTISVSKLKIGHGWLGTYVSDEIIVLTDSEGAIEPFLARHAARLVGSAQVRQGTWVHRLKLEAATTTLAEIAQSLHQADPHQLPQNIVATDLRILETYALVRAESRGDYRVTLNPVIEPAIRDHESIEAAIGPHDYKADARTWPYMGSEENGYGIFRAWRLLEHADRIGNIARVAVIDTDFRSNDDLHGVGAPERVSEPPINSDVSGHGTHVAAAMAARSNNEFGTVGIAGQAVELRLFEYGIPTLFHGLSSIGVALEEQTDIINLSWTCAMPIPGAVEDKSGGLNDIFSEIANQTLIVAAAGNHARDIDPRASWTFPCAGSAVLCVGGLDESGRIADPSNYGARAVASKVDIYGPFQLLSYADLSFQSDAVEPIAGTSLSAAFISGVAALLKSADPTLTASELKNRLLLTAKNNVEPGQKPRVNPFQAIRDAVGPTPPVLSIVSPSVDQTDELRRGSPFTLSAESYDFDSEEPVTIQWRSDLDGELGEGALIQVALSQFGTHSISAIATDISGASSMATIEVTLNNHLPDVHIEYPQQDQLLEPGIAYTFRSFATDRDNGNRRIDCDHLRWSDLSETGVQVLGVGCEVDVPGLLPGVHILRVSAVDETGDEAFSLVRYTVSPLIDPGPPSVEMVFPSNHNVQQNQLLWPWGARMHLEASAQAVADPDGEQVLRYRWYYQTYRNGLLRARHDISDQARDDWVPSDVLDEPCSGQTVAMTLEVSNVVGATTRIRRFIRLVCP